MSLRLPAMIAVGLACVVAGTAARSFAFPITPVMAPARAIVPDFAAEYDNVGSRVAINGPRGVGSSAYSVENGVVTGAAFLFDVATGSVGARISPGNLPANSDFGVGLALSGNRLLVGADDEPAPRPGSAYLFDATTNALVARLEADDAVTGRDFWFGQAVALTGQYAIVGAPVFRTPAVYVFNATTGDQMRKLTPALGASLGFGAAVAANDSVVVVGSPFAGTAYLFDLQTGMELGMLTGDDATPFDQFGASVAIAGNLAVVGAYHAAGGGAAYVFDLSTGQQLTKLTAPKLNQFFGAAVAVDSEQVLVGAPPRSPDAGSAYLFDAHSGALLAELVDGVAGDDYFGASVALEGSLALVGDVRGRNAAGLQTGAVYAFAIPEPASCWLAILLGFAIRSRRHD